MNKIKIPVVLVSALLCGARLAHADPVAVTPYRPSVSTPASLSAPGWLEVEVGAQSSRAVDPPRRESLPYALKLAFTPDWGVRVTGDAWVRQLGIDGDVVRGAGDTTVVLKRRIAVDEASAFGAELGLKMATARRGLGSGHSDLSLNGIYSADLAGSFHVDLNASATHLGGAQDGESPWQKGWAASLSRNLTDRWSVAAELSGTQRNGVDHTSQVLVATTYLVSPALAVDFGVSKGLSAASGGWSSFAGMTFLAGRLF